MTSERVSAPEKSHHSGPRREPASVGRQGRGHRPIPLMSLGWFYVKRPLQTVPVWYVPLLLRFTWNGDPAPPWVHPTCADGTSPPSETMGVFSAKYDGGRGRVRACLAGANCTHSHGPGRHTLKQRSCANRAGTEATKNSAEMPAVSTASGGRRASRRAGPHGGHNGLPGHGEPTTTASSI